ncbi:MAG: ATP-grasp domain-containing protein [Pseudomonadota bacterium]
MQWILQQFEDTEKLAHVLDRQGVSYSWHRVVPFVGDLDPEPVIVDPGRTVLFGSYTLWRYAARAGLWPGVFRIAPFVRETPWQPFMLNGPDALFLTLRDVPRDLPRADRDWFVRPVADSKESPGQVRHRDAILALANQVLALDPADIPRGSLRHDTELMLTPPARILQEWRVWVVDGAVRSFSLYKQGSRVVYRPEIDDDAASFAADLVRRNPGYGRAYVLDICRTEAGLRLLETNCINAAGFYAADLGPVVSAIEQMQDTGLDTGQNTGQNTGQGA